MNKRSKFTIPDEKACLSAIGSFNYCPKLQDPFEAIFPFFDPIPPPGPDDWLSAHKEKPQTF